MIIPMQRVYLLLDKHDREKSMKSLRSLGTVHVELELNRNNKVENIETELSELKEILVRFDRLESRPKLGRSTVYDYEKLHKQVAEITKMLAREADLLEEISSANKEIKRLADWGDFSPADLEQLRSAGVSINLYEVPKEDFERIRDTYDTLVVAHKDKTSLLAIVSLTEENLEKDLPGYFVLPQMSRHEFAKHIARCEDDIEKINQKIRTFLYLRADMHTYSEKLEMDKEFEIVQNSIVDLGDGLEYLQGFVPRSQVDNFKALAKKNSWAYVIREPEIEEAVPTKLKQNLMSKLINPVLAFLEIVPGYNEPDTTGSFFVFFSIFVAMIIGDAAYGVIIILAALSLHVLGRRASTFIKMLYVLGLMVLIWGAISGTWFASLSLAKIDFFKNLTQWQLSSYAQEIFNKDPILVQRFIMRISFSLALLHLSFARLWRFVLELPNLKTIANLGTLALLISLYQLILFMVNIAELPSYSLGLLIGGFATIIIFGKQEKGSNFFLGIAKGLAGLFLSFLDTVNIFADIMSYIRLFAVGIASFSIANSFNNMGASIIQSNGFFLVIIAGILVIIIGHIINFTLGILSVIVHAVRLNLLEFSNHIGIEWSGIAYRPFAEKEIN